ncbi:unnamed protein product [Prorocentrum cordatum]|uniref:Uncharacterized protein n=1 Tax=Prorocentrum cordatum TaxID=2364126 RepID=A0ABN9XVU5_9DINO|nr:unnamed protein product [Polarella glacialis]
MGQVWIWFHSTTKERASDCPDALPSVPFDSHTLDRWGVTWCSDSGRASKIWTCRHTGAKHEDRSCRWARVRSRSLNATVWFHPGPPLQRLEHCPFAAVAHGSGAEQRPQKAQKHAARSTAGQPAPSASSPSQAMLPVSLDGFWTFVERCIRGTVCPSYALGGLALLLPDVKAVAGDIVVQHAGCLPQSSGAACSLLIWVAAALVFARTPRFRIRSSTRATPRLAISATCIPI